MENNKYNPTHNEHKDTQSAPASSGCPFSGESAANTVRLKDGPWQTNEKDDKHHNTEGKSIEEATDPSKLSQL